MRQSTATTPSTRRTCERLDRRPTNCKLPLSGSFHRTRRPCSPKPWPGSSRDWIQAMTSRELRDLVRREQTAFAWDEWAQLGVFAEPKRTSPWAADPEALILLSLQVGRVDPRLFDAVLD